jgi:HPt (histidine-containing phosphotransfer) domain-containing protein
MSDEPVIDRSAIERLGRLGGPDLVRRMLELYLENGPERARALGERAAAGDVSGVERSAHTMKSSAGNLGAVRLQRAAERLEAAAAAGSIDSAIVSELLSEFEESSRELRRVLEERSQ